MFDLDLLDALSSGLNERCTSGLTTPYLTYTPWYGTTVLAVPCTWLVRGTLYATNQRQTFPGDAPYLCYSAFCVQMEQNKLAAVRVEWARS